MSRYQHVWYWMRTNWYFSTEKFLIFQFYTWKTSNLSGMQGIIFTCNISDRRCTMYITVYTSVRAQSAKYFLKIISFSGFESISLLTNRVTVMFYDSIYIYTVQIMLFALKSAFELICLNTIILHSRYIFQSSVKVSIFLLHILLSISSPVYCIILWGFRFKSFSSWRDKTLLGIRLLGHWCPFLMLLTTFLFFANKKGIKMVHYYLHLLLLLWDSRRLKIYFAILKQIGCVRFSPVLSERVFHFQLLCIAYNTLYINIMGTIHHSKNNEANWDLQKVERKFILRNGFRWKLKNFIWSPTR